MQEIPKSRSASVILHVDEQVLLQLRTRDASVYPSFWSIFGGVMDPDEDSASTVIREIQEELDVILRAQDMRYLGAVSLPGGDASDEAHYYSAPLPVELNRLSLREGSGFALFGHEDLHTLRIPPQEKLALERHYAQKGFGWLP